MSTLPQDFSASPAPGLEHDDQSLIDFDLGYILALINRYRLWIAAIIAGTLLLGIVLTMLMVPRYVATSKVLVDYQTDQIVEGANLSNSNGSEAWDAQRFLQTQVDIIQSQSLARRVVKDAKLADDEGFYAAMGTTIPAADSLAGTAYAGKKDGLEQMREDDATAMLAASLHTELPTDTRIIPISVETTNADYSAKLANAYADGYIKSNLDQKFNSTAYARQYLAGQLEEARARLASSEHDLNQYSRAAGLIRLANAGQSSSGGSGDAALSVTDTSLINVANSASQATADRITAQQAWESIAKQPVMSVPEVLSNSAVQTMLTQKSKTEADLAEEKSRHLEGHPSVQALEAQVAEINNRIQSLGNSIKHAVYLQYKAAQDKEAQLNGQVSSLRSSAMNEQDAGVQYSVLKRVADTNRALYDSLLSRYNELSASAGAASNNITLVDSADVPGGPSSPRWPLNIMLSLFAGVAFAAVFVFLREHFDDVLRSPEDVEQKLGVPLLGVIPLIEGDTFNALADTRSNLSESYHSLVVNLMYSTGTGLPGTILITSSSESQGKTTTAHAVALDLARLGRSVLHIDADLRRPTLHHRAENTPGMGLAAVLAGQCDIDAALIPAPEPNLTYMTALPIPPNPSLLLGGGRMPELMEQLKQRFDVVVLDGPPMLGLSDAATLSTYVDGVLLMVSAATFNRAAVRATLRRLRLVNARILGAAVTKFDPSSADGEYSYYGYSYYQYESRAGEG